MHKHANPLLRYAIGATLGLLLLNGAVIHVLQSNRLEEMNQMVGASLKQALPSSSAPGANLDELSRQLHLQKLTVIDSNQDASAPQASDMLLWLYPALQGRVALQTPGQQASFRLDNNVLLPELLGLALTTLATLLLSVWALFYLQRQQQRQMEAQLKVEILTQDHSAAPLPEISHALQEREHLVRTQLEESQNRARELELRASQDPLTGLLNRTSFQRDLTARLQDDSQQNMALLAVIRATELSNINKQRGFVSGDRYLQDIAALLVRACKRLANTDVYRLAGSDFAILQKISNANLSEQLGQELKQLFDQYQNEQALDGTAYTGMTLFRSGQLAEQILGRSDLALAKSQTGAINGWFLQEKDAEDYLQGERHWKQVINQVIESKAIMLMQQPMQSMNISIRTYNEILARFVGDNNQLMPTETILAMAQRHDLLVQLEQQIIEMIIAQYTSRAVDQRWGVNLSANALMNNGFLIWLERQLLKEPNVASNLVFELDEDLLDCNLAASVRLFEMLRRTGSRSSISKFGKGLGSFRLYRELKPDYIKLDASLIDSLERDHTSQQFIRMIVEVSHRLGCIVVAEGVENVGQKQLLETLYVDAIQGYLVARPAPIPALSAPNLEII
ncbi:EAL domain-containing protein [Pseudaeromonas sharmana]|uniref:EAL domain-containing protein n=1 Tax=Pseudaeromonas sharmana TaxID=328412 RepID=A0ABV8CRC8_9GAMM